MVRRIRDTVGTAGARGEEAEAGDWAEAERIAGELAGDPLPGEPAPEPASPPRLSEPAPAPASAPEPSVLEAARGKLRRHGADRTRMAARLATAEAGLYEVIREAHAAGVPKLTIARDAGVSRQTVYNVLERGTA